MARRTAARRAGQRQREKSERIVAPSVRALNAVIQDIKVLDMKAGLIRKASRLLPFLYVLLVLSLLSAFALGVFGVFLALGCGSLISGPTGYLTRRADHRDDLVSVKRRLAAAFPNIDSNITLYVMGIDKVRVSGLVPLSALRQLDGDMIQSIDKDGRFPLGDYRHLVLAMSSAEDDNRVIGLPHEELKTFPWAVKAQSYEFPDSDIHALLNGSRETTLVWS